MKTTAPEDQKPSPLRQVLATPAPSWMGGKKTEGQPPGPLPGLDVVAVAHTTPPQVKVKDAAAFNAAEQAQTDALFFHVRPALAAKALGLSQHGGSILESLTLACHRPTPENLAALKSKVELLDFELSGRWEF